MLGLEAVLIVLVVPTSLPLVESLVTPGCMIWVGDGKGRLGAGSLPLNGGSTVGLVDGGITTDILHMASALSLHDLVTTRRGRRCPRVWYLSIVEVSHAAVGGVTAAVTHIARYRKVDPPPKPGTVPLAVPRDASTVLAFTKTVRHYRRAPVVKVFEMPVLTNLGPLEAPFYHSGGLLPFPLDTAVRVLIPTLFSRDGCWGLRTVSATEVLLALDVSDALIPRFAAVSNTLLKSLLPGRALVASYKALFPDTEGHPVREGLMVTGGVGMLEDKQSFERLEEKKSCAAEVAEDARSPPKASGPTGMDGAKEAVELRKGAGVIATDAILRQTERKEREKAAVKHDDAQVPEYLWVEHMLQDFEWKIKNGERRVWSQTELADIPEYLTVLRRWALSWWKQNLLREFERYLGEDVSAMAMKHPQVVEWNSKKVRYCWIPTSGRSSYVSWYRGRWGLRPQDMEAGGDAIRRA
ncbi:hypothetical protein IV203_032428 [Nitzschia inconspicua]|uniref:Uncharacterized protein n=1 Tax=Nitzschia inconspicua TaxID=303405 RepID=A0A9K3KJH4_9STRA|nr:hypothetical protein IV203_032428 [Nitzschia inconspicua]